MTLSAAVKDIINQFEVKDQYLNDLVEHFVVDAAKSLDTDTSRGIPMIPSFVTKIPHGKEKGLFLAADLGGSNFRVCSVCLNGDSTTDLKQMKWAVPIKYMSGTSAEFWNYLADRTAEFLTTNHPEKTGEIVKDSENKLNMGFTFSFPIHQTGLNRGTLIRWTKGYDIKDAVGTDVCEEFQKALDERRLPIHIAALVNDTVGCLLARSYETGSSSQTVVGSILGTGTNAAYSEKISRIKKLSTYELDSATKDAHIMIVNTEWGSFDNDLKILPNTEFDKEINLATPNPDFHMFEKRVSGMFLGEIVRRILEKLNLENGLFSKSDPAIAENSNLYRAWSTDTSFLSLVSADDTLDLDVVKQQLEILGVARSSLEERKAVKDVSHAVALRSARLVAGIIAGLLKKIRAFDKFEIVDIGMDGAVIEYYPQFEKMMREAWKAISAIGAEKEKRITIGISKDGSGIGGALCAAMAP